MSLQTKHVSHKISKVRWRPVTGTNSEHPTVFLTGGCDGNDGNMLGLWMIQAVPSDRSTIVDDIDQLDDEPVFLCSAKQCGDVADLLFLDRHNFLSASSNGDLNLFGYTEEFQVLKCNHAWSKLHRHSIAGIASLPGAEMVATMAKDGSIKLLQQPLTRPDALAATVVDRTCLAAAPNAMRFLQRSTLGIVTDAGQLKLWDAKAGRAQPSKVFEQTNNAVPYLSMDQHPSQSHIVVAGAEDGSLYVWDLRQEVEPLAVHRGHECEVLEVKFHPDLPNNLFTCSEDGSLWHWGSNQSTASLLSSAKLGHSFGSLTQEVAGSNYWLLSSGPSRSRVVINDMLAGNTSPVNSLDVIGSRVVSGLDGDQVFVFSDVVIC